jgi:methionyl-tRNA formyltransferase
MFKFDIKFDWTVKDLIDKIMEKWPKFLNKTLVNYGKRLLWEVVQNNDKATYCQKIEKEDWEINPYQNTLQEIYNKYRGYYMRPKIFFNQGNLTNSKRVIIEHLKLDQKIFESKKDKPLFIWNELNKCILEISLKPEWKKTMDRESFKSGYIK